MTYGQQLLARGCLAGGRRTLRRQIELRFGSVPPALDQRIEAADQPLLDRLSERFVSAVDWRELLD